MSAWFWLYEIRPTIFETAGPGANLHRGLHCVRREHLDGT
jgi:hypothetical protein